MRDELWKPVAEAGEVVRQAMEECADLKRPTRSRLKLEHAVRLYIDLLVPLSGTEPAFQFHAAYENFLHALDAVEGYLDKECQRATTDDTDATVRQLTANSNNLIAAYKAALVAMATDLERIRDSDDPDEEPT